ncbi:MAG TPA: FkbM family methyltransferase [Kofleriaceae bacterium]|nr:FkbM family methyltransferase [Kofleriaceae bacterium]
MHPLLRRARALLRDATTIDVARFTPASHPLARRKRLLDTHGIDLVFDVGANLGQYATEIRDLGYAGWIISYEPLSSAFAELERAAARDPKWRAVKQGLGPHAGTATLNIAGNSQSSSVLPMLEAHVAAAPESQFVGTETIELQTLARALDAHGDLGTRVFVKIDAQGYERAILESAPLERVTGMQLEMSLVPLYAGETLMSDMLALLEQRGFVVMSLEPGYSDPRTGRLLQVDGVFFRE